MKKNPADGEAEEGGVSTVIPFAPLSPWDGDWGEKKKMPLPVLVP